MLKEQLAETSLESHADQIKPLPFPKTATEVSAYVSTLAAECEGNVQITDIEFKAPAWTFKIECDEDVLSPSDSTSVRTAFLYKHKGKYVNAVFSQRIFMDGVLTYDGELNTYGEWDDTTHTIEAAVTLSPIGMEAGATLEHDASYEAAVAWQLFDDIKTVMFRMEMLKPSAVQRCGDHARDVINVLNRKMLETIE